MNIYTEAPIRTIDVDGYAKTSYLDSVLSTKASKSCDTLSGILATSGNEITKVADPTSNQDVATQNYTDNLANLKLNKAGDFRRFRSGILVMGSNKIINVADPTGTQDVATKKLCRPTSIS